VIYLSGVVQPGIPVLLTPNMGNRVPNDVPWAADTGCYTQGDEFNIGRYYSWLAARQYAANRCLFATAPDVVGDAEATWHRSSDALPALRVLGYKAALVAQDGFNVISTDWDAFDVLFIGGTTQWKLTTEGLVQEAKRFGKWVHMGRVNSEKRYRWARLAGCDSADGTYLAFRDRGGNRGRGAREVHAWASQQTFAIDKAANREPGEVMGKPR
jgi:hypothetical protein